MAPRHPSPPAIGQQCLVRWDCAQQIATVVAYDRSATTMTIRVRLLGGVELNFDSKNVTLFALPPFAEDRS